MNRQLLKPLLLVGALFAGLIIVAGGTGILAAAGGKTPQVIATQLDTTIGNFNLGTLYHTELATIDDGSVALQAIGLAGGWSPTQSGGMPARYYHASVAVGTHIYVFGGLGGSFSAPYATCYVATIQSNHTLSSWTAVSSLPHGLDALAAVAVGNHVYVLGGFDGSLPRAEVYRATVNSNGTLSAWVSDRSLPSAINHLGATTVDGFVYAVGGEHASPPSSANVYVSRVGSDGSLGAWTTTATLPAPDYDGGASGLVVTSYSDSRVSKLYVGTGFAETGAAVPDIYSAQVDPGNGALSQWTQNSNYGQNLVYSAGASYGTDNCGGNLYLSGGLQNQSQEATDYVATAVLSAAPDYFAGGWYTTSNLGTARYGHTMVASSDGWLYVIDGSNSTGHAIASVRYGETACAAAGGAVRAPTGQFTSRAFDLGQPLPLYQLSFNTTLTQGVPITLTFSYRASDNSNFGDTSFSTPITVTAGVSHTTNINVSDLTKQYFQYRVNMSRDDSVLTQTPILNWASISYVTNVPPTNTPGPTATAGPAGANLVLSSMEMAADSGYSPSMDHPVHFNLIVKNVGTLAATGHLDVDAFIHLTGTPAPGDPSDTFTSIELTTPLQPGQEVAVNTGSLQPSAAGTLNLYGWANRYRYVNESDYADDTIGPLVGCIKLHDGQSFSDVPTAAYFYTPVEYLACRSVVSGYSDGTFRPYNNTTRGQFAKMDSLAVGWALITPPAGEHTFADVPTTFPFFPFIETAYSHGVISGYACGGATEPCDSEHRPYYRPYNNITRGQLAKIVALSKGWPLLDPTTATFTDVLPTSPFFQFVETVYAKGVVSGYGCGTGCLQYRPGNNGTRGQLSKMLYIAVTQQ